MTTNSTINYLQNIKMLSTILKRFIRDKCKDPRIRSFVFPPVYPPPGLHLKADDSWTPQKYLKKIGGDTEEYADKFESVQEIFNCRTWELKGKGVPIRARKYILKVNEYFRQGVMTFEQLEKRTALPRKDKDD
jgi:hypothetical protein